jgi:hypothetical protein
MARRRTVLDELATRLVGLPKSFYFVSDRRGVVAVFISRQAAIDFGAPHDLYVEGPSGEEWPASWSSDNED